MSDMGGEGDREAGGGEDKGTNEGNPEGLVGVKSLIRLDSDADKGGSVAEREQKVTMSDMNEMGPRSGVRDGDKPNRDENSEADAGVAQLIQSRQETLKLKQMARRAAWQAEVKAEMDKRAEAKLKMEGTSRNQIISGKDKQLFSKISIQARRTFRSKRTQFLFDEVFPIISRSKTTRWNITFDETLNCRLVSKLWKDIIDSSLSTTSAHYHEMFAGMDQIRLHFSQGCLQFFSVDHVNSLNRKCEQEYRGNNPFPFRQLYIGSLLTLINDFSKVGMPYWIEMEKLLQRWGKEIWTVMYVFEGGSIEMMYEFLIRYLSLMPNLRELSIIERDRSENVGADMLRRLGKDVLGPLKSRMERKPLPELPHLHSLVLAEFTPAPLIEAALKKYGGTLEFVKIEGSVFDNYSGEYLDLGQFVAGRELPFKKYSCFYSDASLITPWEYQFPALEELRLDYLLVKEGPEVKNIFKTVNSVGSTIRRLRLKILFDVPDPKSENDWRDLLPSGIKLELPHLEWLDLTVERTKIRNIDYLLPIVSLKEMTFSYLTMSSDASAKDGSGIIQFAGYRDRLYDSNIWTILPEVKLITLYSIPIIGPSEKLVHLNEPGIADLELTNMTTTVHTRDAYRRHQTSVQEKIQRLTEQVTGCAPS